ncbi:phosphoadenosine phosphosulfate reductase [Defluviimonas sp. 20V17]|uniref:Adenosine 5'-phosphosulfate reductase n=1 Tax=Allgaiera indica TaxID=765699 RepID=A0AAN5A173_9RHOB|nr:phosphoadenylyl-sulfate reductase [Allgaiera indica]KDB04951.1 phosphoadenosine phosphosulfate reductase [Defluviimonas sp. 20V17]GHE05728.1 phosphoadenylyl-sulfate reductase (thioredoxin) [Allgaiera indica]SDX76768.1 phosphoadenylylsulfate reductase (thioredoxin) [Allgaiera indica]
MPRDLSPPALATRAAELNAFARGRDAQAILTRALELGPMAMVSSFGADSAVLLHLIARIDPHLPVLFIDTRMLFAETLAYQRDLAWNLGLTDVRIIRPDPEALLAHDADNILHLAQPDACCALRKTEPLERALAPFAGWITGRKRFQTGTRAALPVFEPEAGRLKVNPLARWTHDDLAHYIETHALPRHPLVAKGFTSIGCAPCTTPVRAGEDPRAGRWRGRDKTECGIHFNAGRPMRGSAA